VADQIAPARLPTSAARRTAASWRAPSPSSAPAGPAAPRRSNWRAPATKSPCWKRPHLGGRARRIETDRKQLDNGQHILLGAYSETLRLMQLAGVDHKQAVLKLPLQMRYPPGGGMDFVAPSLPLPAPLHLAAALLRAKGLRAKTSSASPAFRPPRAGWAGSCTPIAASANCWNASTRRRA
jgi:hypothetical protein